MKPYLMVFVVFLASCSTAKIIQINGEEHKVTPPPGTVEISENWYADKGELTNIDYKEYLYWLRQIHGEEANIYQNALPDTLVWRETLSYGEPLMDNYFSHPAYKYYPVVGLTLEQAQAYTNWRSDRVAEMLLIQKGLIKTLPKQTSENYFSIERYRSGDFPWLIERTSVLVPQYSIPTEAEWEQFASSPSHNSYGIDRNSKYNRKILNENNLPFNTKPPIGDTTSLSLNYPSPSYSFAQNEYGQYGITGNVAEMVIDKPICKGGSWRAPIEHGHIKRAPLFKEANCWTGFRNVAHWEWVEIE